MAQTRRSRSPQTSTPATATAAAAVVPASGAPGGEPGAWDDLDALLAELGAEANYEVRLNRHEPKDAAGYLGTMELSATFLDDVMREHGGGKYYARVVAVGAGNSGYRKGFTFRIAGAPKAKADDIPTADYASKVESAVNAALARLQPQKDPMEMALKIVEAMRPAIASSGGMDTATLLDLMDRREQRGLELGRQLAERGDGDGLGSVVRDMAPALLAVLNRDVTLRERTATNGGAPRAALPNPSSPAPEPVNVTYPAGYEWLAELRPFLPMLAAQARGEKDPALYADVVLDNAPTAMLDKVRAVAAAPDFVDTVVRLAPEMSNWPGWFREFVGHVRDGVMEKNDDEGAANVE